MFERSQQPRLRAIALLGAVCLVLVVPAAAQDPFIVATPAAPAIANQASEVVVALFRLPLAAVFACALAFRPRRRGTPDRRPAVIHTQILLAVIGALVMLVVGSSLARAFGIVGAAGLVRYRAKIDDPKDAVVMLSTLAVGLASGVGQWLLAAFGTVFILSLLWVLESFEREATRIFSLKVKTKDSAALKPSIETFLKRQGATFEARTVAPEELVYEVKWPLDRRTVRVSERIAAMDPSGATEVELEQKKAKG